MENKQWSFLEITLITLFGPNIKCSYSHFQYKNKINLKKKIETTLFSFKYLIQVKIKINSKVLFCFCLPFFNSLNQVMHSCKSRCVNLIKTCTFETFSNVFMYCIILTCLRKNMFKTSAPKSFFQTQRFTIYNKIKFNIITFRFKLLSFT